MSTKSRTHFFTAVLAGGLAAAPSAMAAGLPPPKLDLSAWPRMAAPAFGCYLEKTFGHRDPRFNCALTRYENHGDACKGDASYTEGPAFPAGLATRVHPLATRVDLDWEHGELREVVVELRGTWNEAEVRKAFGLPVAPATKRAASGPSTLPGNVIDTNVQYGVADGDAIGARASNPAHGRTTVSLTGFDHMGAADLECDTQF